MASRAAWVCVSFLVLLTVLTFPEKSDAAISSATSKLNQTPAAHEKPQGKSNKKAASDFTFADDEDKLMQKDDAFASSGDGPNPEPTPEVTEASEVENANPDGPETATDDWNLVWPETSENETLPEEPLPDGYFPFQTCEEQRYFCRYGYRGPCYRNEIFTTSIETELDLFHRQPTCSVSSKWDTCLSSLDHHYSVTNRPTGCCTVRYPNRPCFGYPSSYRYCKRTKRCYPCRSRSTSLTNNHWRYSFRGPCPTDQVFTASDNLYGHCTCRRPNHIYCQKTHRCYAAYTQASCNRGQWLVPSKHGSVCRPCPCPTMADGHHIYWSGRGQRNYGRPGCYKSYTQGPCRPGMYFFVDNFATGSWRCVPRRRWRDNQMGLYSLIKEWQLFNDMSLFGPVIGGGNLDDVFANPWF